MKNKISHSIDKLRYTKQAIKESRRNGGIKSIKRTKYGTQYNYRNGTGYWIDR